MGVDREDEAGVGASVPQRFEGEHRRDGVGPAPAAFRLSGESLDAERPTAIPGFSRECLTWISIPGIVGQCARESLDLAIEVRLFRRDPLDGSGELARHPLPAFPETYRSTSAMVRKWSAVMSPSSTWMPISSSRNVTSCMMPNESSTAR